MSIALIRRLPTALQLRTFHTTLEKNAARRGTREKAKKKKVKIEIKKVGFIPHNLRNLNKLSGKIVSNRSVDAVTEDPIDDVYFIDHYKAQSYSFSDIIKFHKESHHPSLYNMSSAPVNITMELNMVAEKKTRFVDPFSRHVKLPFKFANYDDRTILAFCKTSEQIAICEEAGANLTGGPEIIKKIQSGHISLNDFKYVVAHPTVIPDLLPLRGLLLKKFPNLKTGTINADMKAMLDLFRTGLRYTCEKDQYENDLGFIRTTIGTLDMDTDELVKNFETLLKDVESVRPKRSGEFVTWVWCLSPPGDEKFKVNITQVLTTDANNVT